MSTATFGAVEGYGTSDGSTYEIRPGTDSAGDKGTWHTYLDANGKVTKNVFIAAPSSSALIVDNELPTNLTPTASGAPGNGGGSPPVTVGGTPAPAPAATAPVTYQTPTETVTINPDGSAIILAKNTAAATPPASPLDGSQNVILGPGAADVTPVKSPSSGATPPASPLNDPSNVILAPGAAASNRAGGTILTPDLPTNLSATTAATPPASPLDGSQNVVSVSGAAAAGSSVPAVTGSSPQPTTGDESTYTVVKGDTLSGIAAENGVPLSKVEALNPQFSPNYNLIHPGDTVNLPGSPTRSTYDVSSSASGSGQNIVAQPLGGASGTGDVPADPSQGAMSGSGHQSATPASSSHLILNQ